MFNQIIDHLSHDLATLANKAASPDCPLGERDTLLERLGTVGKNISFLEAIKDGTLLGLAAKVRQWGEEKGITGQHAKATVESQFDKLLEEVEELREAIKQQDLAAIVDAVGDCSVVLILLTELVGNRFPNAVSFEGCLASAYEVIKDRTGRMQDGMFIKD